MLPRFTFCQLIRQDRFPFDARRDRYSAGTNKRFSDQVRTYGTALGFRSRLPAGVRHVSEVHDP